MHPWVVGDVDLADPEPRPGGKHGDVAVELAVELEAVDHPPGHGLEPAVEVAPDHAGDHRGGPVVELGGGALDHPVVAHQAAPGDQVDASAEGVEEGRDLPGIVLAVGVHQHHDLALGALEAGLQRRRLAAVAP